MIARVLEMEAVQRTFLAATGPVPVLRHVDLAINAGDFVAITGPSGSGKSTLLNLAALLDQPTAGCVRLRGEDISRLDQDALCDLRKTAIGMVFQKFHLLPHRSALDNVRFRFRYTDTESAEARQRATDALEVLGVGALAERPARLLSGGEMQRVAIARAIALRPTLLVADEPTGNLDRTAAQGVMECFQKLNREGITILLVTHNHDLLRYCNRHFDCRDGKVFETEIAGLS